MGRASTGSVSLSPTDPDSRYYVPPDLAMLSVDGLGFRRGAGALKTLLSDQGLADHRLFTQAKGRGIRDPRCSVDPRRRGGKRTRCQQHGWRSRQ